MKICDSGHQEICFEGRECPFCEREKDLLKQIEDLEAEASDLSATIRSLEQSE